MSSTAMTMGTHSFAALHRRGQPFVLPNAWDVASALLLADAGFPAVGTTSLGVNAAVGLVDGAGTGRAYALALAAAIVPRLPVPVTIDLEGGYSDEPAAVAELAAELAALGAAGINLEDAAAGGGLRPPDVQASMVRAVAAAAPELFVNARTDTYWLQAGPPESRLEETITRLKAYEDAGAGGVFVPALWEVAAVAAVTDQVRLPLNVLWRPGLDMAQLAAVGVARVSTGSVPYRRALAAGLATVLAARDGTEAPGPDVPYRRLLDLLQSSQQELSGRGDTGSSPWADTAGVRGVVPPANTARPESAVQSTPLSRA
jgi:2-methylisocitrate lyase-like PEP mutase family enzyme